MARAKQEKGYKSCIAHPGTNEAFPARRAVMEGRILDLRFAWRSFEEGPQVGTG
jgi:hypothetical protein